uniref:Uncharacterized protein n=1 Tax=Acanthochromis polyacanthus TaxID=80966 RepID=A0A3Q1EKL0_9TELE
MKTFCVVVAVAVVFTFIYIQGNSVFPFTTMQESEETMSNDSPAASQEETSVETWMVRSPHQISEQDQNRKSCLSSFTRMQFNIRQNCYTGPIRCHGCCAIGISGMCCN